MKIQSINLQVTPEVSKQIEVDLNNAIFHGQLLSDYKVNEDIKQRYLEHIGILAKAKALGYLDFTYEDPEKPYDIHEINIEWKPDPEDTDVKELSSYIYSIPVKEMKSILEIFETNEENFTWDISVIQGNPNMGSILSYEIYSPT